MASAMPSTPTPTTSSAPGMANRRQRAGDIRAASSIASMRPEIERVLAAGDVRGADCLHLTYAAATPTLTPRTPS